MRFYVKLVLMIAVVAGLASETGRRMTGNLAYEARVFFIYHLGSDADFEHLLQDTDRMLGAQRDALDAQFAAARLRQLNRSAAAGRDECAGRCGQDATRQTRVASSTRPCPIASTLGTLPISRGGLLPLVCAEFNLPAAKFG